MRAEITQDLAWRLLTYDPVSGVLRWREREAGPAWWNSRFAGNEALTALTADGYRHGYIQGAKVYAHRLIWLMVYGSWPKGIDHINGDRADNRITNLREASQRENLRNKRRSGDLPFGVRPSRNGKRWVARIGSRENKIHLGTFDTVEEATAARRAAEQRQGYHENHGRELA